MRRHLWALAVGLLLLALPAGAEEIVHFKSGTAMPVASYQIDGDMIHVDLGDNAFMAFPLSLVDHVEKAGKHVMIGASNTGGTNVMRPRPDPSGSFPVRGSAQARMDDERRFPQTKKLDPAVDVDEKGLAVYRPHASSTQMNKRSVAVTGHQRVRENLGTPDAMRGATRIGTSQIIGSTTPRRRHDEAPAPKITGIEFRQSEGRVKQTVPTPPPADGGQTSQEQASPESDGSGN